MDVTYAERWSPGEKGITAPLSEEDARRRHERGELYTAILGDPHRPEAFLEVRLEAGFVGVNLLDGDQRPSVTYHFMREPDSSDDLFLDQATWREFDADDEVVRAETYYFNKDEPALVEKKDYRNREAETYNLDADMSGNWEPVPEFGRYESIARRER